MTTESPLPSPVAAYLKALERGLAALPADERADVLRELSAHLEDGLAAGQSPETLLAGMGPADAVAEALVSERLVAVDQRRGPAAFARVVAGAAGVPFLAATAVLSVLMVLNTWYLYAELIAQSRVGVGTVFYLLLFNLPAILVVTLPVAALMAGLAGIPKLATVVSAPTLRRLYPRVAIAGLLAAALLAVGGFALNDRFVPQANRATVDLVRVFILNAKAPAPPLFERSPQEMTMAEVDLQIAAKRAARDQAAAGGAAYQDVAKRDQELRRIEVDRHLKMALPAYVLPLMALGLAIGSLTARRRPVPAWLNVGIAIATTIAIYTVMSLARYADALSGSPALAAWGPLLVPSIAAAIVWAYAKITRKGVYADV